MTIKSKMTQNTLEHFKKITGGQLTLGRLIWAIRQADEITQVAFAEKLNITKQHLCDIEHDRKSISPKLAAKYADTLGYSKEQFVRLALQDLVDRDGLNIRVDVSIEKRKHPKKSHRPQAAA
ncbi:MAG TPA: helix-turn-helix transcriptional regulator [Gammaproteobacteria bacterium]|jgi:transcriptional regulator with XRE-family HTH domain|nr:helix-turn-helix transcriptional regulator [Gammaproteobacteria bacterium]